MTSPPSRKSIRKALRRGFDRARDAILPTSRPPSPALPGTSSANIPNDPLGVVRDRSHDSFLSVPYRSPKRSSALLGTDSADRVETPGVVGNRSQGLGCDMERARNCAPASGKGRRRVSSSQVGCRWVSRLSGSGTGRLRLQIQHSLQV